MLVDNLYYRSPIVGSIIKVRVLVVDDDSTCLSFISGLLKLYNYQVTTVSSAIEALSALRGNVRSFDVVLSDVHMPNMNGVELQKKIEADYQIPVLLMSSDKKEKLIRDFGLDKDASVILKPPTIGELKDLWQYVVACRKNKENAKKDQQKGECSQKRKSPDDDEGDDKKNKSNNEEKKGKGTKTSKKPKLIWSTPLHNKFLEAIRIIGYNRAVPKKIMEFMNVPGLTRENIASHLQKYRLYLRRICEAGASAEHGIPENWNQRPFRSSFTWSQFPTLASNSFLLSYASALSMSQEQGKDPSKSKDKDVVTNSENGDIDKKTPIFGASSSLGLRSLLDATMIGRDSYISSNLGSNIPLNILESSLLGAPKIVTLESNPTKIADLGATKIEGQSSDKSVDNANDNDSASAQVITADVQQTAAADEDVECHHQEQVQPQPPPASPTVAAVGMASFMNQQQPNIFAANSMPNCVATPAIAAVANYKMCNFASQHEPATLVTNMSNLSMAHGHHHQPSAYSIQPHQQSANVVTMPNKYIIQQPHHQQSANVVAVPANYVLHQPQQSANVVAMPNNYVLQHQQPHQQSANVVAMPNNFMMQQPHHQHVPMSGYGEPQPQFAGVVTNIPTFNNIAANHHHHHQHMAVASNNMMNNYFYSPEQVFMSNNVNTPPQQIIVGNQQVTPFISSNELHRQGIHQGFEFRGGTINQCDWAMPATYDDFSMEHLEEFADGLLSNNDPQIGDSA